MGPSTGFSSSCQWRRRLCARPWDGPWEHAGRQPWPGPSCARVCAQCPHLCKGQRREGSSEQWGHSGLLARASQAGAAGHRAWGEGKARARAPPTQCSSSKAPLFPSCLIPPPAGLWPCPPALGCLEQKSILGLPSPQPLAGADSILKDISPGTTY